MAKEKEMTLCALNVEVYLTGSQKRTTRALYRKCLSRYGCRFYIKWYGQYVEVRNIYHELTTTGWQTVEKY